MDTLPPPGEPPLPPARYTLFQRLADLWNRPPRVQPDSLQYRAFAPFVRLMVVLLILMAGVIGLRIAAITYARQVTRHLVQADDAVHRALDAQHTTIRVRLRELADDPLVTAALDDPDEVPVLEDGMGALMAGTPAAVMYLADENGQVVACYTEQPCAGQTADVTTDLRSLLATYQPDAPAADDIFIADSALGPALILWMTVPAVDPAGRPTGALLGAEIPIESVIATVAEETRTHILLYNAPAAPLVNEPGPESQPIPHNLPVLLSGTYDRALRLYQPGVMRVSDVASIHIGSRRFHAAFMPLFLEGEPRGVLGLLIPNPIAAPLRVLASDTIFFILMAMLLSGAIIGGALISTSLVQPVLGRVEAENARMMAILSSVADGVVLRNPEGHIILANPAAVDLLSTRDGFYPEVLEKASRDEESDPAPVRLEIGSRTIGVTIAAVRTMDGDYLGDVLVLRDVTQEAIVERTKDSFIAQISHELRTPLTVIRGYVDVLRVGGGQVPPAARERAVRALLEQTDTLSRMVNESIELASLHNKGDVPVELSPIDLNAFVSTTLSAWQPSLSEAGLKPYTHLADPPPVVAVDTYRMRRALDALLHNACRFSPEGGDLHISTIRRPGGEVCIRIKDPGVGISHEDLPRIFELFYRGEPVGKDGSLVDLRGFGQGLYVAKTIVEAHGGSVEVESSPGAGSTFTVVLPALAAGDRTAA
jgi:signal transduction histidine kinase